MNRAILCDHAVWQRGASVPLEGAAAASSAVSATFRGRTYRTQADSAGRWRLALGPLEAGGPDDLVIQVDGAAPRTVRDILVGELWICSGQSNMEMALKEAEGGAEEIARAHHAHLRLLTVPRRVALEPTSDFDGAGWQRCAPEVAADFSAVGYWFGLRLQEALGVPVGLIQAAVGATPGEAWVPRAVLESDADFHPILARWRQSLQDHPDSEGRYAKAFAAWDQAADQAEREGRPIPGPFPKLVGPGNTWTPGGLFNGMIAPLTGVPVGGVAWYQGAGAPERAYQYRKLFRALIRDWRRAWGREDLPFIFGQEARFGPRRDQPCEHSWAELREAQAMALAEPHTALVVAIDTGEEKNIHPRQKRPLGERWALAARAMVYGQDVPFSGPTLASVSIAGGRVCLRFAHTYGGLRTSDGGPLRGLALSGGASDFSAGNRGFFWAQARLEGDQIVAWCDRVPQVRAVRYAWAQNPDCNLINAAGLPAGPFRTDDWPGVTVDNR